MKETLREPFHYRHRTFFVGLFILVPLCSIPIFIITVLIRSDLFENRRQVYVRYESAQALQPGSAVNIRGIKVGHVKSVKLDNAGSVVVCLGIGIDYAPLVKKNTVARLKQRNFVVGDWEIELVGGGRYEPAVQNGDTLAGDCPLQLDATLAQVTSMVGSVDSMLLRIRAGEGIIGSLLGGGDSLAKRTGDIGDRVTGLLDDIDRTIGNANAMIRALALFGESGKTAIDSFQVVAGEARLLVDEAGEALRKLDAIAEAVSPLASGADSLIREIRFEIREADTLLQALKRHWLFTRRIRKIREGE